MSTPVQFHVQSESDPLDYLPFAANIVASLYRQQQRMVVRVADAAQQSQTDAALWEHPKDCFLPHVSIPSEGWRSAPIVLAYCENRPQSAYTLINLSSILANIEENCQLIVEIVGKASSDKVVGRQRYRQYREQGFSVLVVE